MILGSAATGGARRYWNDLDGIEWHTGGSAWPRSSQQPLGEHLVVRHWQMTREWSDVAEGFNPRR